MVKIDLDVSPGWPDPSWLVNSWKARDALKTLVSNGSARNWVIAWLQLIRTEHQRPTRGQVDAAARAFDKATEKVLRVVVPLSRYPDLTNDKDRFAHSNAEMKLQVAPGSLPEPQLDEVRSQLELVKLSLAHAKRLVRKRTLPDALKALLVRETRGPQPHDFHDMEVSELIDAATNEFRNDVYSADNHKNWRAEHKDLIQTLPYPRRPGADIKEFFDPSWQFRTESERDFLVYIQGELDVVHLEAEYQDSIDREW